VKGLKNSLILLEPRHIAGIGNRFLNTVLGDGSGFGGTQMGAVDEAMKIAPEHGDNLSAPEKMSLGGELDAAMVDARAAGWRLAKRSDFKETEDAADSEEAAEDDIP
jgi:hypothetical protein